MNNQLYRIYYTILVPMAYGQHPDQDMAVTSQNPVKALDIFHKEVQAKTARLDRATGNTLRPKLKATDYKVTKFVQTYQNETPPREWIESEIDLPASPNPDTTKKEVVVPSTQDEMTLNDARR